MNILIAFFIVNILLTNFVSTQFYVEIKNSMPRIGRNSFNEENKQKIDENINLEILKKIGKLWFKSQYENYYD
jgi:hypothetical protein